MIERVTYRILNKLRRLCIGKTVFGLALKFRAFNKDRNKRADTAHNVISCYIASFFAHACDVGVSAKAFGQRRRRGSGRWPQTGLRQVLGQVQARISSEFLRRAGGKLLRAPYERGARR